MSLSALSGMSGLSAIHPALSSVPTLITDGLANPTTWVPGTAYLTLGGVDYFSFRLRIDLDPALEGMILEAGGSARGILAFVWQGSLYFEAGNGQSEQILGTDFFQISWEIPSTGEYWVEASANMDFREGRLYVDGVQVDAHAMTNSLPNWTGNQDGGLNGSYGSNKRSLTTFGNAIAGYPNLAQDAAVWRVATF